MAREYGKNWFSMWTDEDFCTGRLFDKLFYQVLLGQSGTNDAGICPINFRKWRKAMRDGDQMPTEADIKASLVRQERRRYVFTDDDTGEVLIRSHVRRDQVHRQPALMVSALRDLKACQSPKFAVVMLSELARIEMPVVNATTKQGERLRDSLKVEYDLAVANLKTLSEGWEEPLPEPFVEDFPEGLSEPKQEPNRRPGEMRGSTEGFQVGFHRPPVVVEVEVASSPSVGGWVGEVGTTRREIAAKPVTPARDAPPPDRCPKHINDPDPPNCGACGGHRRHRERWEAQAGQREADGRAAFWAEVRHCADCDDRGFLPVENDSVARCPKHDWSQLNMPDLNPDGTVNLDPDPPANAHLDPAAIARCRRCDTLGYRGTVVCDHRDHTPGKGRAAVEAELAKIRHRRVERAKEAYGTGPASTEPDETAADDHSGAEGVK